MIETFWIIIFLGLLVCYSAYNLASNDTKYPFLAISRLSPRNVDYTLFLGEFEVITFQKTLTLLSGRIPGQFWLHNKVWHQN